MTMLKTDMVAAARVIVAEFAKGGTDEISTHISMAAIYKQAALQQMDPLILACMMIQTGLNKWLEVAEERAGKKLPQGEKWGSGPGPEPG